MWRKLAMSHQDFTNPLNVIVIFSHRIQNQGNHNCLCQKPVWARYNQQTSLHCNLTFFLNRVCMHTGIKSMK